MSKQYPQLNKNIVNKCPSNRIHLGNCFAIREGLLRINKRRLIENTAGYENGYRFHSHHSKAILTIRTQSTTIPNYASPNLLYIYKKWKCVESLTVSRWIVDSPKRLCNIGYITFIHAYWFTPQLVTVGERGNLHWYAQRGVTGGLDRPLKAEKDLANQFYLPSL